MNHFFEPRLKFGAKFPIINDCLALGVQGALFIQVKYNKTARNITPLRAV